MREKRWLLLTVYGIFLAIAATEAVKATRAKFKIATTSTTTVSTTTGADNHEHDEEEQSEATTVPSETNATTGHTLTGIPQIDYIWDPNLPRELNGYNLSEYPFYNSIPEDIDFKCDGLHDGFYASVPHKCQVYHHCLFGTRYDFLCANFTAFDQKTFICHFVSEVDCANSKKYWHRNDALYKATTSSTTSTSTTTTTTPAPVAKDPGPLPPSSRWRRPFRRRPAYDYYEEDYYDDDYERPPRPRGGYDRRDDYDYDDRKYRRDRDFRERDFRDRPERPLMRDDRDRDRVPLRNNRRGSSRDPLDEESRVRNREEVVGTGGSRVRDPEEPEDEPRRYNEKRIRDEYDYKDPISTSPGSTEGLVKPAAPISSVYSRPRAPPKIRRPVPLSEQDKYAYKTTASQSTSEEPRRRLHPQVPTDAAEDDYYEDEIEDVRPRRPLRRRPAYRDREFYDVRERPFRTRYRDETDDIRPRKHPERSRDRYYDRHRSLDRGRSQDRDRPIKPKDEDDQQRPPQLSRRPYDRTTSTSITTTTSERPTTASTATSTSTSTSTTTTASTTAVFEEIRAPHPSPTRETFIEDYSSEYYDEEEEPQQQQPVSTPRPAVRVVKRPFLPSRGGNANPRGLHPVGAKAYDADTPRRDEKNNRQQQQQQQKQQQEQQQQRHQDVLKSRDYLELEEPLVATEKNKDESIKEIYDAYKVIKPDYHHTRAENNNNNHNNLKNQQESQYSVHEPGDNVQTTPIRQNSKPPASVYGSSYKNDEVSQDQNNGNNYYRAKQRINEVPHHRLQDIPESEYDVTLNEALTPSLSQETNLPSGFVLPVHRQIGPREPALESSDNSYKISRVIPQSNQQQQQLQQQQQQQKPSFLPSPPFLSNDERNRGNVYFRTPEAIHISGPQYRSQRGPWNDYTGY